MRVKIGNVWHAVSVGQPIAIELTPRERQLLADMAADATRFAVFDPEDGTPNDIKRAWLAK